MKKITAILITIICVIQLNAQRVVTDSLFASELSGNDSTYFFEPDKHTGKSVFIYFDDVQQNDGTVAFGLSIDETHCGIINTYNLDKTATTYRSIDNGDTAFVVPIVSYQYWPAKCKVCIKWTVGSATDTLVIRR